MNQISLELDLKIHFFSSCKIHLEKKNDFLYVKLYK